MKITEKQLAIHITTRCNLNCALCATMMPVYEERNLGRHVPAEDLFREIDCLFDIYDYINNLTFSGGESLSHPNVFEVSEHCLKRADKFDDLRIFSNGTIIPEQRLVDLIKSSNGKIKLVIDDYGEKLSSKTNDIKELFSNDGMGLRVIKYHGDVQYYGGWIDNGYPVSNKGRTPDETREIFERCHLAQNRHPSTMNGRLHNCSWDAMLVELGYLPKSLGLAEFVDMFDQSITLEDKKRRVADFGGCVLAGCEYCNGFDVEKSPRFPAAEQKTRAVRN